MLKYLIFPVITLLTTNSQPIDTSQPTVKFLALGDSYTIGESVSESDRWPVQLISTLHKEYNIQCDPPRIIARTGWRTDQLIKAIEETNIKPAKYNLISLLIGVNNQYQNQSEEIYKKEFEELLTRAILLAGGKKERVFVLSIPDYGYTPFGEKNQKKISTAIDQFNAINKSITNKHGVTYINITDISREGLSNPDFIANDGLHPSAIMYSAWVDRIVKELRIEN